MEEPLSCENVSMRTEERSLLEDIIQQCTEDHEWEHWSMCDSDSYSIVTGVIRWQLVSAVLEL